MERWIEVARVDELVPGQAKTFTAGDRDIALFNDNGTFHALDDVCPHQGASLGEGLFHDGRVICPLHAWVFDVRTGRCPRDSHDPVRSYPARCAAGRIEVNIARQANGSDGPAGPVT